MSWFKYGIRVRRKHNKRVETPDSSCRLKIFLKVHSACVILVTPACSRVNFSTVKLLSESCCLQDAIL